MTLQHSIDTFERLNLQAAKKMTEQLHEIRKAHQAQMEAFVRERDQVAQKLREAEKQIESHVKAHDFVVQKLAEAEKQLQERAERIRVLEARRQAEKRFNFAARYGYGGFASPFKVVDAADAADAFSYSGFQPIRAGKTAAVNAQRQRAEALDKIVVPAPYDSDRAALGALTLPAANLVRSRAGLPIKRTVREWNLAAENIAAGRPVRHGFRWTRSEEEKLVADYRAHKSPDHFVRMHKRELDAIAVRVAKLVGVIKRGKTETQEHFEKRCCGFYFPAQYDGHNWHSSIHRQVTLCFTDYKGVHA